MSTPELVLLTGGARSGKSRTALEVAAQLGGDDVSFIATAEPADDEMRARIERHRGERNPAWETLEAPLAAPAAVRRARGATLLLDCITLFVANLLRARGAAGVEEGISDLVDAWRATGKSMVAVTNEVGLGIVPDNALARSYRDALGTANQRLMRHATRAYLLVAGAKLCLKGEPR